MDEVILGKGRGRCLKVKWKVLCVVLSGVTQEVGIVDGTLECGEEASSATSLEMGVVFASNSGTQ
jgi:hypothetical protein